MEDGFYRRTIETDGFAGAIEVWDQPDHARLAMRVVLPRYDSLMKVVQRASRLFDLGADALHIGRHLGRDRALAGMVAERPGLRVPGAWDGFELAVRAVLGQQLAIVDSVTITKRLVHAFGQVVEARHAGLARLFPQPEILAEADLTALGISKQHAETIVALARAVGAQKITFEGYRCSENMFEELRLLPHMDESVVSYIAMRTLGEPDALPYKDLGLRRALGSYRRTVSPAELLRSFEKFRPWRAYAAMHLWAAEQAETCVRRPRSRFPRNRRRLSVFV